MKRVASFATLASVLLLGGCAYDDYGYGGVNVGYGTGYYDDYPYGPYGYAPYGWYDGYYYPGNGYWLYDRRGTRHRWSDRQRQYWEHRRERSNDWKGPPTRPWHPEMRNERRWSGRDGQGDANRNWRGRVDRGEVRSQPQQPARESRPAPAPAPVRERSVTRIPRGN
jgi:hypothetical protein